MKRINKRQLMKVLDRHEAWLRDEPGGERANLSGYLLHRRDFTRRNLSHVQFLASDLSGSDFTKATLCQASFYRATLKKVHFQGADLTQADLAEVDARGSSFDFARLEDTNFAKALFNANTHFYKAIEQGTNYSGATLQVEGKSRAVQSVGQNLNRQASQRTLHTELLYEIGKSKAPSGVREKAPFAPHSPPLEVSIEIPDHWDEATTNHYLEGLAIQLNTWHREEGGKGLKIDALGIEQETEVNQPLALV
ncbi:MAG TPA: hypothetical protein DCE41_06915 [Cytophagales bacterium]|nr:hypothetical protein [Cytophagales bacterium]HAA19640.1 hypothetical protein [Cytophagales bacterium]HAP60229.1 hypothetical protein [Cytophagales bacterium]